MRKIYSKQKFEYELSRIRRENNLRCWNDVTSDDDGEYVYEIPLYKGLSFLIYSSVSRKTNKTRGVGNDAVRVVYKRVIDGEASYHHVRKCYRTENLFMNLEKAIILNCRPSGEYLDGLHWSRKEIL